MAKKVGDPEVEVKILLLSRHDSCILSVCERQCDFLYHEGLMLRKVSHSHHFVDLDRGTYKHYLNNMG